VPDSFVSHLSTLIFELFLRRIVELLIKFGGGVEIIISVISLGRPIRPLFVIILTLRLIVELLVKFSGGVEIIIGIAILSSVLTLRLIVELLI
jgi:hypothetical protein